MSQHRAGAAGVPDLFSRMGNVPARELRDWEQTGDPGRRTVVQQQGSDPSHAIGPRSPGQSSARLGQISSPKGRLVAESAVLQHFWLRDHQTATRAPNCYESTKLLRDKQLPGKRPGGRARTRAPEKPPTLSAAQSSKLGQNGRKRSMTVATSPQQNYLCTARTHSLGSPTTFGSRTWTTKLPFGHGIGFCEPGTSTATTLTEALPALQLTGAAE